MKWECCVYPVPSAKLDRCQNMRGTYTWFLLLVTWWDFSKIVVTLNLLWVSWTTWLTMQCVIERNEISIWLCKHKQLFEWAKDLQVWRFFTWWNRWKRIMLQKGWPNMARFSICLIILHNTFSFQSLGLRNIPKNNLFTFLFSTPATSDPWHQRGTSLTNTLSIVSWHFLGYKSSRHLSQ